MRRILLPCVAVVAVLACLSAPAQARQALDDLMDRASRYVSDYERAFTLLVLDEEYLQWVERPTNPGSNLSRTNPGGGMQAGGERARRRVKSDYVLIHLGEGKGWMPVRDVYEVDGVETRHHDDRVAKLFTSNQPNAFDLAAQIHEESKRHSVGYMTQTINLPTLALMLAHQEIRGRFSFKQVGDELVAGRLVERVSFKEVARPTLIKTTRGRDMALEGRLFIEPSTGTIVRTELVAADPAVRATINVTYRRDAEAGMWVPARMDEHYKAAAAVDDVFATATYGAARRFEPRR